MAKTLGKGDRTCLRMLAQRRQGAPPREYDPGRVSRPGKSPNACHGGGAFLAPTGRPVQSCEVSFVCVEGHEDRCPAWLARICPPNRRDLALAGLR
eukprot:CAMPEP_0170303404 /NCGR_PEP_ID=MMETSP0116_2-20130129/52016_1 /TAXON_ID=400756 /ORGANISM="Durinskia baltica, Strain CSIRO CS-38" /LENGTH=95 /DNA_ID=CAMNT_0010555335 /DNA_START=73 /DNA_END=356 /DNA_ORIENTATION=-